MEHTVENADLGDYSMERLQKELAAIQVSLELLFTKNNSLDDIDITEGGGSTEDQAEYLRLNTAAHLIVSEINKRHVLSEVH